mmetsp:Transcript_70275/g.168405  ORF Transcript_70275/g.168405 Transcript_70275/m.168405 type:complete len:265 (+) Transcript_70275:2985-3779(+)
MARSRFQGSVPKAQAGGQRGWCTYGQDAEGPRAGYRGAQEERGARGPAIAAAVAEEGSLDKGDVSRRQGGQDAGDHRPAHKGERGGCKDRQRSNQDGGGLRGHGGNAEEAGGEGVRGLVAPGRAQCLEGELRREGGSPQAGGDQISAAAQEHCNAVDVNTACRQQPAASHCQDWRRTSIFQPQCGHSAHWCARRRKDLTAGAPHPGERPSAAGEVPGAEGKLDVAPHDSDRRQDDQDFGLLWQHTGAASREGMVWQVALCVHCV